MVSEDKILSHIDQATGQPSMVNVGDKYPTKRIATSECIIQLNEEIIQHLNKGEISTKKGGVFQTGIIAGTMAVKKTADLIPMCHSIPLDSCTFEIEHLNDFSVKLSCTVSTTAKTGVEMEALTGVSVAALTVYDMCKSLSHNIIIKEIKLVEKKGGKSDFSRK